MKKIYIRTPETRKKISDARTKPIAFVIDEKGCHNVTSHKVSKHGYAGCGLRIHNQRITSLHRYAYSAKYGPIPEGMYVCHSCDNRKCVNLEHLFLGTQQENIQDAANKGRIHNSSKTTPAQRIAIRRDKRTQAQIAKSYNVSQPTISLIKGKKGNGIMSFLFTYGWLLLALLAAIGLLVYVGFINPEAIKQNINNRTQEIMNQPEEEKGINPAYYVLAGAAAFNGILAFAMWRLSLNHKERKP